MISGATGALSRCHDCFGKRSWSRISIRYCCINGYFTIFSGLVQNGKIYPHGALPCDAWISPMAIAIVIFLAQYRAIQDSK